VFWGDDETGIGLSLQQASGCFEFFSGFISGSHIRIVKKFKKIEKVSIKPFRVQVFQDLEDRAIERHEESRHFGLPVRRAHAPGPHAPAGKRPSLINAAAVRIPKWAWGGASRKRFGGWFFLEQTVSGEVVHCELGAEPAFPGIGRNRRGKLLEPIFRELLKSVRHLQCGGENIVGAAGGALLPAGDGEAPRLAVIQIVYNLERLFLQGKAHMTAPTLSPYVAVGA